MLKIFKDPAQIITVNTEGKNYKRGKELDAVEVLTDHSIITENDLIKDIIPTGSIKNSSEYELIPLINKVILPGFIECHTHSVFAGSRANEFRLKLKGATYEEITRTGGGINTTVHAVRNSSFEELVKLAIPRIQNFIIQGVTTIEIKSGYGLDFENEIKLLKVINHLNELFPIEIVSTFLGAHTFPAEYKNDHAGYCNLLTDKMIPFIHANNLAKFCDVFCEVTAFSLKETDMILKRAIKEGLKIKLHTEQFNNIGGFETALRHNAVSVEHLEMLKEDQFQMLSSSETTAVLLPGVSFFLDYQYAPARKLIDNNAIIAIATDYNPGSSNINNISFIMSLAAIKMKMSIEEVISAYTINAAKAIDVNKQSGSIEIGKNADFAIFNTVEYSDIIYNASSNLNIMTIKNGNIIFEKQENK
ncbi:MAG: imidazolonepropionase [Ignavibacteriaceae bacterium]|nr:imidazolonepropionase [Ignavibacteriaceae bacterium]